MSAPTKPPARPPRVFLSYSHDSPKHAEAVLALAERLRADGIDAWLDRYEPAPAQGWPRWMLDQIEAADFVLVVCTPVYRRRFRGQEALGVAWEGAVITQEIYEGQGRNRRFVPVLLDSSTSEDIPVSLRGVTHYHLNGSEGYEKLYRRLTGQPEVVPPGLGELRSLPPRQVKSDFFRPPAAPEPAYPSDEVRQLSRVLEEAHTRLEEAIVAGQDPTPIRAEILDLKRRLREGGQLRAGDLLHDGGYRLIEPLGHGGFATVWKAYDRKGQRLVAVKALHSQWAEDRTRRERFFRGARKMAALSHPGIVRVFEERLEDGGYQFFVMEYLAGGDLRQAVLDGLLSRAEALAAVLEVGQALQHAHDQGVVHRDVKPANVLLDGRGRPKLTDFDLVRAFDTTGGTRTAANLGTFLYTAPEAMADAKEAGVPADVYSLAMTAAFALHGADLPLSALTDAAAFREALPCPMAVKVVLARATAAKPAERFGSVPELVATLREGLEKPDEIEGHGDRTPAGRKAWVLPHEIRPRSRASRSELDSLLRKLAGGEPTPALEALVRLRVDHQLSGQELAQRLPDGKRLLHLIERGPAELPEGWQARAVLTAVEALLPSIGTDLILVGAATWALDYFPSRSSAEDERQEAATLREPLLQPLREEHPPPAMGKAEEKSWARIPGGSFEMGSPEGEGRPDEHPAHRVRLSPFRMLVHPVTNREIRHLLPDHEGEDDLPAINLDWYQAYAYAAWLGGRLPTEAEWEYAARADSPHAYADRGGHPTTLDKVGWYAGSSRGRLHPVQQLEPNPWGLYDLCGNVWEWVVDWYDQYAAEEQQDPWGPPSGRGRVMRGGGCWSNAVGAHVLFRNFWNPGDWNQHQGFRVVRPSPPGPTPPSRSKCRGKKNDFILPPGRLYVPAGRPIASSGP